MDQQSKILLTVAVILISLGSLLIFQSRESGRLRIIACDVGQGDGMLIVTPDEEQIVVDGGPGSRIVDCLGQKTPFSDRTIDMVILTHPQRDHMEGLVEVLARYQINNIVTTGVENDSELFRVWEEAVANEGANIHKPKAGEKIVLGDVTLDLIWPPEDKYVIWDIAAPSDLNDSSVVFRLKYKGFCGYFTGDLDKEFLEEVLAGECELLKVAHHGSKTGTNQELLDLVKPKLAIIQVGRNSFGHPNKEVVDLLIANNIRILRNDTEGIIEVETDGENIYTNN